MGKYDDIINLPRPITTNTPLTIKQRAAQFAPYKTITAYHDSTDELETNSDQPKTEIIFDEAELAITEEFYPDDLPED